MPVLLVGAIAFVLGCFVSALTRDAVGEAERTLALGPAPDDFTMEIYREVELAKWNRVDLPPRRRPSSDHCVTAEERWARSRGLPPMVRPPVDGKRRG